MSKALKNFKNQKRKEDWSDQEFNQVRYCGVGLNRELVTFLEFLALPQPYRQKPFHHLMLL
jgi:hypothetical protein